MGLLHVIGMDRLRADTFRVRDHIDGYSRKRIFLDHF